MREIIEGLLAIENVANTVVCEREDVNRAILLGLLCGEHVLIYGPPGTAKSLTARLFLSGVSGCKTFVKQMTRQMPEEAVFGSLDIPRWRKEGVYVFKLEGGLAQAHLALLNEIYDSSDALLRSLLEVLNEREFSRSLANVVKCPLHCCVATSNFFRDEGDAQAVSDRFLIRVQVDSLEEAKNRVAMLQNTIAHGRMPEIDDGDAINFAALKKMSAAIEEVSVPDEILELYEKVYTDYKGRTQNKFLSDRRFAWSLRLVQAGAYLDGRDVAKESDIEFAKYGLVFVGKQSEEDAWQEAKGNVLQFVEEFNNIATFKAMVEKVRRKLNGSTPSELPELHRTLMRIREGMSDRKVFTNPDVERGYKSLDGDLDTLIQECVNKITPDAMAAL